MATELVIHIGPPKTATTTIQAALAAARAPLLDAGVLYPWGPGSADLHLWAAMDLAHTCGLDFEPSAFSQALFDDPALYRGAWQHLLDQTRAHDGPVIWSSEGFTYLGAAGVAEVAKALAGVPGRIVWVARRPSQAIPSCYAEEARRTVVGPFEQYVRQLLAVLLGGQRHEADYLDGARLMTRWAAVGMPVDVVPAGGGLDDTVVRAVLRALTDEDVPVQPGDRRNAGLSDIGAAAWQSHLALTTPRYVGATTAVLDWFCRAHPAVLDRERGGRLALAPAAAEIVDIALGYGSPTESTALARDQLRTAVTGTAPLTCRVPGALAEPNSDPDWRRAVTALPGHQHRENAKWALIDTGSAVLRRRRPVRRVAGGR